MNQTVKYILIGIASLLALIALSWLLAYHNIAFQSVFKPLQEQVRRDTFETSKAYRDGAVQELMSLRVEYLKAPPELRPAMAAVIRHKAAGVPEDALNQDLRDFLKDLK